MSKEITKVYLNGVVHAKAIHQMLEDGSSQGWLVGNKQQKSVMSDEEDTIIKAIGISNFIKSNVREATAPANTVGWFSAREFSAHIPSALERKNQENANEDFLFCLITSEIHREAPIAGTIDYNVSFYNKKCSNVKMEIPNLPCGSWSEYQQFSAFRSSTFSQQTSASSVQTDVILSFRELITNIKSQVSAAIEDVTAKSVNDRSAHLTEQQLRDTIRVLKKNTASCKQHQEVSSNAINNLEAQIREARNELVEQINIDISTLPKDDLEARVRISGEEELGRVILFSQYGNEKNNAGIRPIEHVVPSQKDDLLKFASSPESKPIPAPENITVNEREIINEYNIPPASVNTNPVSSSNNGNRSVVENSKPKPKDSFADLSFDVERLKTEGTGSRVCTHTTIEYLL